MEHTREKFPPLSSREANRIKRQRWGKTSKGQSEAMFGLLGGNDGSGVKRALRGEEDEGRRDKNRREETRRGRCHVFLFLITQAAARYLIIIRMFQFSISSYKMWTMKVAKEREGANGRESDSLRAIIIIRAWCLIKDRFPS